jgi:hypothetical protein
MKTNKKTLKLYWIDYAYSNNDFLPIQKFEKESDYKKELLRLQNFFRGNAFFPNFSIRHGKGNFIPEEPDNVCNTCGKEMDITETNYGTEDILTCVHCYSDAQNHIFEEIKEY